MNDLSKQAINEHSMSALSATIEKIRGIAEHEFDSVAGYPGNVDFDVSDVVCLAEVRDEIIHTVSQEVNRTLEDRLVLYKARYENLLPEKVIKSVSGNRCGEFGKRSFENIREYIFKLIPYIFILNCLQRIHGVSRKARDNKAFR